MRNKCNMGSVVICAMAVMLGFAAQARTFEFKQLKSTGTTGVAEYWWEGTEKSKSSWFQVKIGGATKIDDTSEMEIRAATVLKSVKDKKTGINDIATFEFDPINKGKAIFFMISTGSAFSRERESYCYGNVSTGWQLAGVIIEIWQKGNVVKHWSNMSGKDGKVKLTDSIKKLRINRDGHPSEGERYYSARDFDNATEIYSVDQKGERVDINEVLKPFRESEEGGKTASKGDDTPAAQTSVKNTVAPKLRTCEFLLNKDFKKNAKFYLCLFSASWCPPCRAEMPRIAKTYAETLKDDPDIELIHFSRDQDEEKAMAWAKEHDVKFSVVKPRGGNPLDLHTRGIPHLFIVKADGTLVEEGHPMRIFNEEKFREIKRGGSTANVRLKAENGGVKNADEMKRDKGKDTVDGYTWSYSVENGEATIVSRVNGRFGCAVSPNLTGNVVIPAKLGGVKVTRIGESAFRNCSELTSLVIPDGVTSIGGHAFYGCYRLVSVTIPEGVREIGNYAFVDCNAMTSVSIPASLTAIQPGAAFHFCARLTSFSVSSRNERFVSHDGIVFDRDMKTLVFYPRGRLGMYVIPSGITAISSHAFATCRRLTSVTIPSSVTSIEKDAFFYCSGLMSVTMSGERPETGGNIFGYCKQLTTVHVPANAKSWAGMKEWQGISLVFDAEAK